MMFDDADFYDCRDAASLSHETVEDALEEYLDLWAERDCDMAALIAERCPITVSAYKREQVAPEWVEREADWVAEAVAEHWTEAYGDDAGSCEPTPASVDTLAQAVVEAIRAFAAEQTVWPCKKVGERTYSAAELEALMRASRPSWFEVPT